jgi:dephospho-CoA kinase
MQPLIRETIMGQLAGFTKAAVPAVILDVPLLFEQGYDEDCDLVVVVTVDKATQLARLMKRDGLSQMAAQARVAAQMPLNEKAARADIVIDNNGDDNHLRQQVAQLVKRLN